MTITVDVRHRLGDFVLEAAFSSSGRLTALFGPSGSGKTSLVNAVAGLMRPQHGRVVIDGRVLVDTEARVFVPMHLRRIGYVFQDARLFPHMSVRQNLGFGRFFAPRGERYADRDKVIELLGIGRILDRKPEMLSGGEKQRVAIGRALIASPRLVLMDEPLASLDETRKAEIMPYIERLRDEMKVPIVYVSHSVAEMARLATDVVLLADGKVTASGPTAEVLQRLDLLPAEDAGEGGAILDTTVDRHDEAFGMTVLGSVAGEIHVPRIDAAVGTRLRLRLRARDVMVATERPHGLSALNILPGRIAAITTGDGPTVDIRIDCNRAPVIARITRQSSAALGLRPGIPVYAVVKTVSFGSGSTAPAMRHDA